MVRFEWDEIKAATNRRKHDVSFVTAQQVFLDPLARITPDRIVLGEERWKITGWVQGAMLVVVFTAIEVEGEEIVRIISARRPDRQERRDFEGGA
ncbi:MAG: BrnT family toxin [Chloroflexota bacterium]|nr:BrnT family toxin [Chloroflexota bacterium]